MVRHFNLDTTIVFLFKLNTIKGFTSNLVFCDQMYFITFTPDVADEAARNV